MKKTLKQNSLFHKLKEHKISIKQYIILIMYYNKKNISEENKQTLSDKLFDCITNTLTDYAIKALDSIEKLFITDKKIKTDALMGSNYDNEINDFIKKFPTTKLPNGKYARSNKKNIETNFKWFFENYEYSWENIQQATSMYINEYRSNSYMYMRTALYFIRKNDGTKTVHSDLADYCDKVINNESYTEKKYFKTKIL